MKRLLHHPSPGHIKGVTRPSPTPLWKVVEELPDSWIYLPLITTDVDPPESVGFHSPRVYGRRLVAN